MSRLLNSIGIFKFYCAGMNGGSGIVGYNYRYSNSRTTIHLLLVFVIWRLIDQRRFAERVFHSRLADDPLEVRKGIRILVPPFLVKEFSIAMAKGRCQGQVREGESISDEVTPRSNPVVDVVHPAMNSIHDALDHLFVPTGKHLCE
jgi:hypothetical protein